MVEELQSLRMAENNPAAEDLVRGFGENRTSGGIMIKIDEIAVSEFRGIRSLALQSECLDTERRNFVISGPDGSGKSSMADAIQCGLRGRFHGLAEGEQRTYHSANMPPCG